MILLAFRHGLRASELVDLRWDQFDFNQAVLHVRRVKNGTPATHPLTSRQLRALRKLQREAPASPFVFVSERGAPFSVSGFRRMIERATEDGRSRDQGSPTHVMPAGMPWPTRGPIRGPCRPTSAIETSATQCVTLSWHLIVSAVCGRTEPYRTPVRSGNGADLFSRRRVGN